MTTRQTEAAWRIIQEGEELQGLEEAVWVGKKLGSPKTWRCVEVSDFIEYIFYFK